MEKRYRALRLVGTLYKILGGIVLVLTLISAIGICLTSVLGGAAIRNMASQFNTVGLNISMLGSALIGIIGGLIALIGGALGGLTFYATGEGIFLLISIEENTRAATVQPVTAPPTGQA